MVRASSSSKLSKLAGPLTKLVTGAAFSAFTPGRDVDEDEGAHELGGVRRQRDGGHAAERHADDAARPRGPARPRPWPGRGRCCRPRRSRRARRRSGRGRAGRRPAAGRPSARATVSQVWAFCAPPCTSTSSGGVGAPDQAGDRAPGRDLDVDPAHVGRPRIGEAVLGGVLVEEPELVVGDQLRHAHECPIRTPARPGGLRMRAMPERRLSAVVLAAGEGTRMRSERPKPLHLLCGRPMILHVLDAMAEIDVQPGRRRGGPPGRVGHQDAGAARARRPCRSSSSSRSTQSGTGDALAVGADRAARRRRRGRRTWSCCPGDTPLLRPQTLAALVRAHRAEDAGATLLTAEVENPTGYGRVVHGKDDDVTRVVEEADATEEEQAIDEVNTSIYCFRRSILAPDAAPAQPGQRPGRVLPDRRRRRAVRAPATRCGRWSLPDSMEAAGVNDRAQLAVAEAELRDRINERWMRRGVTMWDPERTYVDAEVAAGRRRVAAPRGDPAGRLRRSARGAEIGPEQRADRHHGRARAPWWPRACAPGPTIGAGARVGPFACSSRGPRWPAGRRACAPALGARRPRGG